MTPRSPAVLEIPISTSNNSFVVQYSKVSPLLWRWQGGRAQHDQLQVVLVCKSPWLESSWIEFWAQETWDCFFQTSGPQGQPHVNAGLRSVRQLSAIWLQTKRNCLVSWSARWSYICQVGFLLAFWRFPSTTINLFQEGNSCFHLWVVEALPRMCTMYISQDFWRGQYLSGGYNTYLFGVHSVQSMKEECIQL